VAGRRERGVGQGHAERFADHLGSSRGAEELASSTGSGAGAAEHLGGGFERELAMSEAGAGGLDFAGVFTLFGEQGDAAGDQDAGQRWRAGKSHHHGGQALVAGGDADHGGRGGQRADEAAEDTGGVVAVGQRIEHAGGTLGAAVAGVGAIGGEGDGAERLQFLGGGVHEQADFPVAGVIAARDGDGHDGESDRIPIRTDCGGRRNWAMNSTRYRRMSENEAMSGIQFVTDEKGRKVGVLIDLKKHGAVWEDFWDGLVSESRRKEKAIPYAL